MLELLHAAERDLPRLIATRDGWRGFKLDREPPLVERLLREYRGGKLFLHRIHPCAATEASYHPHPWPSAMRLVDGTYELALGHGAADGAPPPVAARVIARAGFEYEMIDPNMWHSVRPIDSPVLTIMVSGPRWTQSPPPPPPAHSDHPLSPLSNAEVENLLNHYRRRLAA